MTRSINDLKALINEERKTYNEDIEKHEQEVRNIQKLADAKNKVIKNKLIQLYDGEVEIARNLSIEDIIENIA